MPLVCPRCQRANPDIAIFCYNDGAELRPGTAPVAHNRLAREFVFPSGRRCQTFDELAQGCQDEWAASRELLRQGVFGQFFSGVGRLDLAKATQEAMAQGDADIGLTAFIGALPVSRQQAPKLDINPRRLLLGNVTAGETRQLQLTVTNQGQGILQGSLKVVEGGDWLKIAGSADGQCPIKATRDQQINLLADTRKVPAAQTYGAKLTVITNGGVAEVLARMDLVAQPFARPPFQGAKTPREMAEKMRGQPKAAVPLLESGEVGRWFAANGWNYPIRGTPARGVAGVQQFFEAMGLSKPPPVQISHKEVALACQYPHSVRGQVNLHTTAKKWVYANIDSDSPWLRVLTPLVSGPQQAAIGFEIDPRQVPGDRAEGKLTITANAGQTLSVRVMVEVRGAPARARGRGLLQPVCTMALAFLLLRLLFVPLVDFLGRGPAARTAAAKARIQLDQDSPLLSAGGWLSLPWNRILLGGEDKLPRGLFNTRGLRTDKLAKETNFEGRKCATYADLAKAIEENRSKVDLNQKDTQKILLDLFKDPKRDDLVRATEKAVRATEQAVKVVPKNDDRLEKEKEKAQDILIEALAPVIRADYRGYYVSAMVRHIVIWTFWLGAVAGALWMARRGGPGDLVWGLVAGAVAGIGFSASLACAFLVAEIVPQTLWALFGAGGGVLVLLFLWVPLALLCWAALGAAAGLIAAWFPPLKHLLLVPAQQVLAWICRMCGLRGLAAYCAPA